jgi:hypothetical protein
VLCVAAHNGFNKVTGIDFSMEFCERRGENLQHIKKISLLNFSIINKDAACEEIPADADNIFSSIFFRPGSDGCSGENILTSYKKSRDIYIIYLNPLYKKELFDIGFKVIIP